MITSFPSFYCIRRHLSRKKSAMLVLILLISGVLFTVFQVISLAHYSDSLHSVQRRPPQPDTTTSTSTRSTTSSSTSSTIDQKKPSDVPVLTRLNVTGGFPGVSKLLMASIYSPAAVTNRFKCVKSSHWLTFDQVNDDYCDCPDDGSDEPSTGACAISNFYCAADSTMSHLVPSSRINDGVCDCCDGSDEWRRLQVLGQALDRQTQQHLGRFLVPCPNTCS